MERSAFPQPDNNSASRLTIGLLIADSSESRMFMIALSCRKILSPIGSSSLVQVPNAGLSVLKKLDSARIKRSFEPLAGEVLDFARDIPGGIAIRRNDMSSDTTAPAIVVTKRVTKDQWEPALIRSQAWASSCQKVFSSVIEHTAVNQSRLVSNPGDLLDPELEHFKIFILSLAREMQDGRNLATFKNNYQVRSAPTFR